MNRHKVTLADSHPFDLWGKEARRRARQEREQRRREKQCSKKSPEVNRGQK